MSTGAYLPGGCSLSSARPELNRRWSGPLSSVCPALPHLPSGGGGPKVLVVHGLVHFTVEWCVDRNACHLSCMEMVISTSAPLLVM